MSSQDHLAAAIGCSVEEANREIAEFEAERMAHRQEVCDERGYPRCHYTITPQQLAKIKAREMKRDEKKHYIRAEKPSMRRKETSMKNLLKPYSGKRSHHKGNANAWPTHSEPYSDPISRRAS